MCRYRHGARTLAQTLDSQNEVVAADLTDPTARAFVAADAIARFGRIDGLVSATRVTTHASVLTGTAEVWDHRFALNARAAFFLMQAGIQEMSARKAHGAILNILSMNAHCSSAEHAIYASTKAALATLTKNAAHVLMADRIRANGFNLCWVAAARERRMQADALGKSSGWLAQADAHFPPPAARVMYRAAGSR